MKGAFLWQTAIDWGEQKELLYDNSKTTITVAMLSQDIIGIYKK
jgi:hypothetical protein